MMQHLRASTRPLHERLETRLDIPGRAETREGYVDLLRCFFGFHVAFEAGVADWDDAGLDLLRRRKAPLIRRDLRALGLDGAAVAATARCPAALLPEPASLARALGGLYAVEGAALGGRVFARHFHARWGLTPETGLAYFSGYGEETGAMWAALGARIDEHARRHAGQAAEMVDAARRTLEALERWMCSSVDA